jgi:hypothetical protein
MSTEVLDDRSAGLQAQTSAGAPGRQDLAEESALGTHLKAWREGGPRRSTGQGAIERFAKGDFVRAIHPDQNAAGLLAYLGHKERLRCSCTAVSRIDHALDVVMASWIAVTFARDFCAPMFGREVHGVR